MLILVLVIWLAVGGSGGMSLCLIEAAGVVASLAGVMAVMAESLLLLRLLTLSLAGGPASLLLGHIALPVGDDEGGEGQGDNQSDEAQQRTPYRQRQQQYGWVEAHGLAHNLGCHYHVGNQLYHSKEAHGQSEDDPEALPRVGGFEHGKECGGDDGEGVEIGHQVHDADEDAQAYGHGEVHDRETYAEHHAHTQCHETLPADIVVEFALHVFGQHAPEGAVLLREYAYPVGGEVFVVEQDEEHIEQRNHRGDDADDDVSRLTHKAEQLGHGALDGIAEVVAAEEALYLGMVFLDQRRDICREVIGVGGLSHPAGEDVAELLKLLNHRRDDEVDHSADDRQHHDHGDDDGERTYPHAHLVLHKLDDGVEQIGEEPCHTEGQQHSAEIVDQTEHTQGECHQSGAAYKQVKGYLLAHILVILLGCLVLPP